MPKSQAETTVTHATAPTTANKPIHDSGGATCFHATMSRMLGMVLSTAGRQTWEKLSLARMPILRLK